MDYKILKKIRLSEKHVPTGRTVHYSEGEMQLPPAELLIARYEGDSGFYLLHINSEGEEVNDTFHENMEDALEQANWEFGVSPDEWIDV